MRYRVNCFASLSWMGQVLKRISIGAASVDSGSDNSDGGGHGGKAATFPTAIDESPRLPLRSVATDGPLVSMARHGSHRRSQSAASDSSLEEQLLAALDDDSSTLSSHPAQRSVIHTVSSASTSQRSGSTQHRSATAVAVADGDTVAAKPRELLFFR